jgi:hypothetical protein
MIDLENAVNTSTNRIKYYQKRIENTLILLELSNVSNQNLKF